MRFSFKNYVRMLILGGSAFAYTVITDNRALADVIAYNVQGTGQGGFGAGVTDVAGLGFMLTANVESTTGVVADFEFSVDTVGTWKGTGGNAVYQFQDFGVGFQRGSFELQLGAPDATYSQIAGGVDPASTSSRVFIVGSFGTGAAGFGNFVDGLPTSFDLAGVTFASKNANFFNAGFASGIVNDVSSASGTVAAAVPEPSSGALLAVAGIAAAGLRRHRRKGGENAAG